MDRRIVYAGQIPLEVDLLATNQFSMIGLAKLAAAMLGTSTVVNGLACVPTGPATLTVNVNPGEMYSLVSLESTAYSSLPQDTAHTLMKQGVILDAVNLPCPAPGTAGQSVNFLIQAIYQDLDSGSTVLPYYNAANPQTAWSGPNNSGTPQYVTRKGTVALVAKAGAAATTGSQTTPAPDAGYTGLWVVTVANGQTQILAGNITQYAGAPILPSSLLASIQNGNLSYAVATGTANAHVVALTPSLTQRVDGMVIRYKAPAANTGALTLNDGLGAIAVVGAAHAALQGGETVTNGDVWVQWNSSVGGGSYIMLDSSGGAMQVAPATKSQHAMQLGQATGRYLGTQTINASQTVNPGTYNGVTATTWRVRGAGGGGGGAGAPATGSSTISFGTAGTSAAYAEFVVPAAATAVTVGAAGVAGAAGAAAGNGGNSIWGSAALLTLTGGAGGTPQGPTAPPYLAVTSANVPVTGTLTPLVAVSGSVGQASQSTGTTNVLGGNGGSTPIGTGGTPTTNGNGIPATGIGAGGGAASCSASTAARPGGAAAQGGFIVDEYA